MESVTTSALRHAGALLDPSLQDDLLCFGSTQKSAVAAPPGWALYGQWRAAWPAHRGSRTQRRRAQGSLNAWGSAVNPVLAGVKGQLGVPLTCPAPGPALLPTSRTGLESKTVVLVFSIPLSQASSITGSTALGTGSSSIFYCCPAICYVLPKCHVEIRSEALSLFLHPAAAAPCRTSTFPALWQATSCSPCMAPLPEIKA